MNNTMKLQLRLQSLGFDPGPLDGIPGPKTRKALKAFQASLKLAATGELNTRTSNALFGVKEGRQALVVPPWYEYANTFLGTKEVAGKGSNSTIMGWAKALGKSVSSVFTDDDIAWCGLFVAHVMQTTNPNEPIPANPLGAQQWNKYGERSLTPSLGDVLVFWRGSPTSWKGHVGFYAGENATSYKVLGGNQSNRVTDDAWISKDRLISARRPTGSIYKTQPLILTASGKLSTNEA